MQNQSNYNVYIKRGAKWGLDKNRPMQDQIKVHAFFIKSGHNLLLVPFFWPKLCIILGSTTHILIQSIANAEYYIMIGIINFKYDLELAWLYKVSLAVFRIRILISEIIHDERLII